MSAASATLVLVGIIAFGLVSRRVSGWPITMPMVFVVFGVVANRLGLPLIDVETETVALLGEITLAIILFSDAVRIDVASLRREFHLPGRLLLVALPLALVMGTMVTRWILGIPWFEAALIAAIVAPTDAALGEAVVSEPSVPLRIRQALNVESGLNDGLVLPAVLLALALVMGEEAEPGFWAGFIIQQVGLGVIIGAVVGAVVAGALGVAQKAGWVEGIYAQLITVAAALGLLSLALAVEANGLIAAYVGGIAFGAVSNRIESGEADHLVEFSEDAGRALAIIAFFAFGLLFIPDALDAVSMPIILCALAALTLGRLVPVAVSMLGMGLMWPTVAFMGWFGPRGLATILFGLIVLEDEFERSEEIFAVIAWTVLLSVMLHGASATWGSKVYGRWIEGNHDGDMAESMPVANRRPRWLPTGSE